MPECHLGVFPSAGQGTVGMEVSTPTHTERDPQREKDTTHTHNAHTLARTRAHPRTPAHTRAHTRTHPRTPALSLSLSLSLTGRYQQLSTQHHEGSTGHIQPPGGHEYGVSITCFFLLFFHLADPSIEALRSTVSVLF